jgi:hypothetical protein
MGKALARLFTKNQLFNRIIFLDISKKSARLGLANPRCGLRFAAGRTLD